MRGEGHKVLGTFLLCKVQFKVYDKFESNGKLLLVKITILIENTDSNAPKNLKSQISLFSSKKAEFFWKK